MAKFVTNSGGVTNSVPDDYPDELMRPLGLRPATDQEVAEWYSAQGLPVPSNDGASAPAAGAETATTAGTRRTGAR